MFVFVCVCVCVIGGHEQIDVRVSASIVFSMLGRCYGRRMPGLCSLSRCLSAVYTFGCWGDAMGAACKVEL